MQNRTDAARAVSWNTRNVSGPEQLFLKPREEKDISIEISPKYLGNLESVIKIDSEVIMSDLPPRLLR